MIRWSRQFCSETKIVHSIILSQEGIRHYRITVCSSCDIFVILKIFYTVSNDIKNTNNSVITGINS